jgi:DNA primase
VITAEQVAKVLKNPTKKENGSWMACCPAHDDKTPSLSVMDGDDVAVVLKCFAGCDYKFIAESLDL